MVSEAGTVRLVELELRPRVPPPDPLRMTVQVLTTPGATGPGLHTIKWIEVLRGGTLTVPPVPVTVTASPVGEAPRVLVILTGRALPPDGVIDKVATTPSEIGVVFNPQATHM